MNAKQPEQALDKLETLILFSIERPSIIDKKIRQQGLWDVIDASSYVKFDNRRPNRFYTFGITENDRLYTTDHNLLINHAADIIGDGAETMCISRNDNLVKWMGFYPTRPPLRNFVSIGKADKWYEMHYMSGNVKQGWTNYQKYYAALNKDGKSIPVKMISSKQIWSQYDVDQIIMACSIIEDAHRINSFTATASLDATAIFPVSLEGYKDFFKLREAPRNTPTGRLNPILHWVKKYIRQCKNDKLVEVKKYLRGTESVTIDGMTATLSPN